MKKTVETWLYQHARALEVARYDYHFKQANQDTVIEALECYQNEDGGFGNSLEPDFFTKESTPIATWVASRIIEEIALDKSHPLVTSILEYLKNTPHQKNGLFFFSIPKNNDYPHAIWWHHQPKNEIQGYNPTASLLGFMYKYSSDEEKVKIKEEIGKAIEYFLNHNVKEMHELRMFVELYHYIKPALFYQSFFETLQTRVENAVEMDSNQWFETYCIRPSQLIISPDSPGYERLKTIVQKEHVLLKQHLTEKGIWDIEWSWADDYPEAFLEAKKAWQGIRALEYLLRFKAFGEL